MPRLSYLSIQNTFNTTLVFYNPASTSTIQIQAKNIQQLRKVIEKESKLQQSTIYIICDEADQQALQDNISRQESELLDLDQKLADQKREEPDLIGQVESDRQNFILEKTNNMLQKIIKKTQAKIFKFNLQSTLKEIEENIKKSNKILQFNKADAQRGEKKAKKKVKMAQKQLEYLQAKRGQLMKKIYQGSQPDPSILQIVCHQQDSQSLLCKDFDNIVDSQ